MKKIIISLIALFVIAGFSYGQEADQNPNYKSSLDEYTQKLENSDDHMGTTVQDTYKAIDEWQDKKDAKIANKKLAIENRHERRLARINNRGYYSNSGFYGPDVYADYSYGNNGRRGNNYNGYGNRRNNYYNQRSNYYTSAYYGPRNRYPVGYRIGGSVRLGNNVRLRF